ncbi:MAG: cytochrome c [Vicinamibacterales bacterium]
MGVVLGLSVLTRAAVQQMPAVTDAGFQEGARGLTPSERAGREIWFKATAGNERFHTYVFQQRLGVLIDWGKVLGTTGRDQRFETWGLINDPDCCAPGSPNCPKRSRDETYGFDYCPGDDALLAAVGKADYRDPACDFVDAPVPGGGAEQRQSACDLRFGTSTGALGFRKFPNPRFQPEKWRAANGSLGSWEGYAKPIAATGTDARASRLMDGSIEPPYLIGMACGACHISFKPANPPKDPAHPSWENIDGLVGNQFTRSSEILASGMARNTLEWQVFAHARPGTVDTSAVPNDQISNPGTMNPIINLPQRPTFAELVTKWRKTDSCAAGADADTCWCEPGREKKCWARSTQTEPVHHILKGGEDSIGALEAIQRVYFNIGSCSEQCWVNHITDLRQADPAQRGFGQTPFEIGQCRRDCPNFRAVEDRLPDLASFLMSSRPAELFVARGLPNREALIAQLDREFAPATVSRGREVFVEACARCHSSQPGPHEAIDFYATVDGRPDLRKDFLSSEVPIRATEVETERSRALHSNHMKGHVWEQYGSETLRTRPQVPDIAEPSDGGRGYYRPVSLLSVWAFAPFMHNNAIGPEVCGAPADPAANLYNSPYVLPGTWRRMPSPPPCWHYDPSVEGRFKLFKASMEELLNPNKRMPKVTLINEPIIIDGPNFTGDERGFRLQVPAGIPSAIIGNLRHKEFVQDLVLAKTNVAALKAKYRPTYGDKTDEIAATLQRILQELTVGVAKDPESVVARIGEEYLPFIQRMYSNSMVDVENEGHPFGQGLPAQDKQALIAFLATL